ncbi:hypothetical protein B0H16DRAFT_1789714 [Mycena metata]|uniref:Uncharacterized protein n=1 Tax=Mycena metata TaxID=1033252 RepID=A0AAD7HK32_9AGAR|nr:hypothetical protein B0H16DRAFT_1789714 [Mycena metata]
MFPLPLAAQILVFTRFTPLRAHAIQSSKAPDTGTKQDDSPCNVQVWNGVVLPEQQTVNETTPLENVAHEVVCDYQPHAEATSDPNLWNVQAQGRVAWMTEATLPASLPVRNARHAWGDLSYEYTAIVTFTDGRTVDVPAGHTTFVPVDDVNRTKTRTRLRAPGSEPQSRQFCVVLQQRGKPAAAHPRRGLCTRGCGLLEKASATAADNRRGGGGCGRGAVMGLVNARRASSQFYHAQATAQDATPTDNPVAYYLTAGLPAPVIQSGLGIKVVEFPLAFPVVYDEPVGETIMRLLEPHHQSSRYQGFRRWEDIPDPSKGYRRGEYAGLKGRSGGERDPEPATDSEAATA